MHTNNQSSLVDNMNVSCFHLAYYLASWGMYRRSTALLHMNHLIFTPVITYISEQDKQSWKYNIFDDDDDLQTIIRHYENIQT